LKLSQPRDFHRRGKILSLNAIQSAISFSSESFSIAGIICDLFQSLPNIYRRITATPSPQDPSFDEYWRRKQSEIEAMTFHFGYPDLMITLTFNNSWLDVTRICTISQLALTLKGSDLDMRFQPYDSMNIWRNKISRLSQNSWQDLADAFGFGTVSLFCQRLEFQARGAPHTHLLLWLKDSLPLETIGKLVMAEFPQPGHLDDIISANMMHKCLPRCRPTGSIHCKFNFPNPPQDIIFQDEKALF
jgi:hypothetical protein